MIFRGHFQGLARGRVPVAKSGPCGGRRQSGPGPRSVPSGEGRAGRDVPPVVGSRLGPAPARPRRPPQAAEAAAPPARDSHVRIPPEGVGDVLHHPLHQHRHLLACLGHVGGGRGGSGAPPGERRAAGGSSAGERARVCAGLAAPPPPPQSPLPPPPPPPSTSGSRRRRLGRGAHRPPGLRQPGWSPTLRW